VGIVSATIQGAASMDRSCLLDLSFFFPEKASGPKAVSGQHHRCNRPAHPVHSHGRGVSACIDLPIDLVASSKA